MQFNCQPCIIRDPYGFFALHTTARVDAIHAEHRYFSYSLSLPKDTLVSVRGHGLKVPVKYMLTVHDLSDYTMANRAGNRVRHFTKIVGQFFVSCLKLILY